MDHPSVTKWIAYCWSDEGAGHVRTRVDCIIELANGARIGAATPPAHVKEFLRGPERSPGEIPVYYSIPCS
jgi:hypothetical protein